MTRALFAALLLLAACGEVSVSNDAPVRMGVSFTPDAAGLSVSGTGQRVDFGRSPSGVIAALSREIGAPRDLGLAGCPQGVVQQLDWDGLTLSFTAERFVGWRRAGASAGQVCS